MFKGRTITAYLLIAGFVLPILLLVMLTFSANWVYPNFLPERFTLSNWNEFLFKNARLKQSFLNSLIIATAVSLFATAAGFITSRWIAYHKRRNFLLILSYFPYAISPVIFAVCLKFYFLKAGIAGNLAGVVLAQLIITFPYGIIFFTSFWNRKVKNYVEVASTLGSNDVITLKKIIFPIAKQFLTTCFFQCFIISWFEYGLTTVIGYGKVETLTINIFQFIKESNTYYASLSSCLLVVPPVLLLWFNKKFIFQQTR